MVSIGLPLLYLAERVLSSGETRSPMPPSFRCPSQAEWFEDAKRKSHLVVSHAMLAAAASLSVESGYEAKILRRPRLNPSL